ncbi:MAG: hypothetical protein QXI60_10005 [Thermofilaceae archaeon]
MFRENPLLNLTEVLQSYALRRALRDNHVIKLVDYHSGSFIHSWDRNIRLLTKDYEEVVKVVIDYSDYRKYGIYYNPKLIAPDEVGEILTNMGSIAFGMALALVQTLRDHPLCAKDFSCLNYVDNIERALNRIASSGAVTTPDPEAFDLVTGMVNADALPFVAEADIKRTDFEKLRKRLHAVLNTAQGNFSYFLDKLDKALEESTVEVSTPLGAFKAVASFKDVATLYIAPIRVRMFDPKDPETYVEFTISANTKITRRREYYTTVKVSHYTPNRDGLRFVADVVRNWRKYVVEALERIAAQVTKSTSVPPSTSRALSNYLRAWVGVLDKYGDALENNKVL